MSPWSHRKRERLDGLPLDAYAVGASVLDVGCNRGLIGYHLASLGARRVHGCDINAKAIATARHLFEDVDCESRFEVVDLTKPGALAPFNRYYDIVVMLGVYHKLDRVMQPADLGQLMVDLGLRALKHFAWNGFHKDFREVNAFLEVAGLHCVHQTEAIGQYNAIWRRDETTS